MNTNPLLDAVLLDLKKIRQVCREESLERVPRSGVEYVAINQELLLHLIHGIVAQQPSTNRSTLAKAHSWLDSSAAIEGFERLAISAVEDAVYTMQDPGFFVFDEDALEMLIRFIEYASFCEWETSSYKLQHSPIERFGLRRHFGNFEQLTDGERAQIPWELSDIIYTARKTSTYQECRRGGFDLEVPDGSFHRDPYRRRFESTSARLSELLQVKIECDAAAVLLGSTISRHKCMNAVDARFCSELSHLIASFRASAQVVLSKMFGRQLQRAELLELERELDALANEGDLIRERIPNVQPSIAISNEFYRLSTKGVSMSIINNIGSITAGGDVNFNQWMNEVDLRRLSEELTSLHRVLASDDNNRTHESEVEILAAASTAAQEGNREKTFRILKSAGKWVMEKATEIGVAVVAESISKASGLK